MKLTESEREVFKSRIEWATFNELIILVWWGIFMPYKQKKLMDNLISGISWKFAFKNAKLTPPNQIK